MGWTGPGFVDHHTHFLRVIAGEMGPCDVADPTEVERYHRRVSERWSTPMDDDDRPPIPEHRDFPAVLESGLLSAAQLGLVQITEAGMHDWAYLDALQVARDRAEALPCRVRILVASGLAEQDPKRLVSTGDSWVDVIGVKFYADGWLGPRTCAVTEPFKDRRNPTGGGDTGILFLDADTLAKRADQFAERGLTIATHAIGDRAIDNVLTAYEKIYGGDCAEAAPRIEHAQLLSPSLIQRMADLGVVACIQPCFAYSDREAARVALDDAALEFAYRWDLLLDAGVRVITGSDYPIEPLSPMVGLQRLITVEPQIDVDTALALLTDAAAGTVELADDPRSLEPDELPDLAVFETRPAA
ncbi:MAG: amidohydrolase family protein [Actinobacteria bacterium]|nr:amidohydrolase family protein [Actinomycetota bacterium]